MKEVFILLLLILFGPLSALAQIDSSYQSSYYLQKVSQYNMFPVEKKKMIMFIGDSITDIAEWNELFGTDIILNRGISADNTFGVFNRLDDVARRKPSKVFIMIGINDISHNIPDEKIISNYRMIINKIRKVSPETRIFVQSILPTNNEFSEFKRHQNKDEHIRAVNSALEKGAATGAYTFVNLYPRFLNKERKLDTKYSNDGLHLTAEGYALWKKCLQAGGYL